MNTRYSSGKVPIELIEQLRNSLGSHRFRRRAVLASGNGQWELVCCTVEGFLPGENIPESVTSRKYPQAVLYEDLLTADECVCFAEELQNGRVQFDDIELQPKQNSQWTTELVSVNNDYMARAGHVIGMRFSQNGTQAYVTTLLAPGKPYYPDIHDAARDWLPFRTYHGHSDGRNGQIFFLLPETRAFIARAAFSEKGTLDITIAGTDVSLSSFLVQGAYWIEKSIHHFETEVSESKAVLAVPSDADRLEYYLLDRAGAVYGFHREDRYSQFKPGENVLGSGKRNLLEQVREAVNDGEGMQVEFKPFVDPTQKHDSGGHKTKLHEIVTTVVAFANTDGGNIYLGIDDDCSITGIDRKLSEWAKAAIDESVINSYLGALKSKIKDLVNEDITLRPSCTWVDGALVVVIEVPPATSKPITIRQDNYLYARAGASNRKVPPNQWKNILETSWP